MIVTVIQYRWLGYSLMKQILVLAKRPRAIDAGLEPIPTAIFAIRDLPSFHLLFSNCSLTVPRKIQFLRFCLILNRRAIGTKRSEDEDRIGTFERSWWKLTSRPRCLQISQRCATFRKQRR